MWRPRLDRKSGPIYTALAGAIAADVQAGRLRPGDRLPPQRDLADVLGVTVTTVTRGYAEAERRGLVRGEVGRGTYVRPPAFEPLAAAVAGLTDLATNALLPHAHAGELTATLAALVSRTSPEHLFNYQPHGGRVEHRAVAAAWLATLGVPADGSNTILTSGAQHAMAVALATLTAPGDVVLCEAVTYSGMRSLAHHLHVARARRPDGRRRVDSGCARRRRARNRRPRSVLHADRPEPDRTRDVAEAPPGSRARGDPRQSSDRRRRCLRLPRRAEAAALRARARADLLSDQPVEVSRPRLTDRACCGRRPAGSIA